MFGNQIIRNSSLIFHKSSEKCTSEIVSSSGFGPVETLIS